MQYTSLAFSTVDSTPVEIPARLRNGGLYVGKEFVDNAPWANVPKKPEAHLMMRDAAVPSHIPGGVRVGNNQQTFPDHLPYADPLYPKIMCAAKNYLPQ